MNILVIGSGGREHAIINSISKSNKCSKIFALPGNGGTELLAENLSGDVNDFELIKKISLKNKISLVFVGPEDPIVNGIYDFFKSDPQLKDINIIAPSKQAGLLEGSKDFAKDFMQKYNIPTAKHKTFSIKNIDEADKFLESMSPPYVLKADGLAAGKGVYISETNDQAKIAVKEIFDGKFGEAKQLLIEEFLDGEEMSFFIISDGKNYKQFGTAQDHKRVLEGDKGKNTGGMGAYSPSRLENKVLNKKIIDKIIEPTLKALKDGNSTFRGFLYAGLMITKGEPFLIEYNVRMGDPECQTLLPKLKTDFGLLIKACIDENLKNTSIEWHNDKSLCIVMCSKGYPDEYKNNVELNLNNLILGKSEFLFHAGTKLIDGKTYSNGGRVLNIVVRSNFFKSARDKALVLLAKLNWENGFYRKDIGHKVIDQ